MPFTKGHKLSKGRPTGSKNKFTFNAEELARNLQIDPLELCLHIAAGDWKGAGFPDEFIFIENPEGSVKARPCISPEMRLAAAKEAAKYMYSAKQAVQVSGELGLKIIVEDYLSKDE